MRPVFAEVSSGPDWLALGAGIFVATLPIFAISVWRRLSRIQIGGIEIYQSVDEEAEKVRERLALTSNDGYEEREYRLLSEYHAQGLAQSKTSFRFSIFFAALGFAVILTTVAFAIGSDGSTAATTVSLVAGSIVEAVAGLFFVQSNRARELMVAFFDRLRTDRKLRDALELADSIEDAELRGRLQAQLALSMAGSSDSEGTLDILLRTSRSDD